MSRKSSWKKILAVLPPPQQADVAKTVDSPAFAEWIAKERPDFVDTLNRLGIRLGVSQFLELSNKIASRYFTIASSPVVLPNRVTFMLRVETFRLASGNIWVGLFSQYARGLFENGLDSDSPALHFAVQPSCFTFGPSEPHLLMVGTGTGVAPFVGILQEKIFAGSASRFGELVLVFGCRKSNEDFICKEFLVDSHGKEHLRTLLTGFSQEGVT